MANDAFRITMVVEVEPETRESYTEDEAWEALMNAIHQAGVSAWRDPGIRAQYEEWRGERDDD